MQVQSVISGDLRVIKVGGGVLRNIEELRKISEKIHDISEENIPPVIVVSALYGVTNELEQFVNCNDGSGLIEYISSKFGKVQLQTNETNFLENLKSRISEFSGDLLDIRDEILSSGEKLTSSILTSFLLKSGTEAVNLDALNLIRVDQKSAVDLEVTRKLLLPVGEFVKEGKTVVIPGFYGSDTSGRTITLGRGGSDFTAGIVASCIGADILEFWKDVDGIMSADPRFVKNPVIFKNISSGMAKEISMLGGKILHPRALKLLDFSKCRVVIKNVRKPSDFGTIVGIRNKKAASIVLKSDLALVTWSIESGSDGNLMKLLSSILNVGSNPYSVSATGATILTIYDTSEFRNIEQSLRDIALANGARLKTERPLSMISVISDLPSFRMRRIRADILSSLYDLEIFEKAVITLNPSLSFGIVIDRYDSSDAVRIIHEAVLSTEKT